MRTPGPSRSLHVQTSTAGRTKSPPLTLRHLTRQPLALAIAPTHTLGVHDLRKDARRYLIITPSLTRRARPAQGDSGRYAGAEGTLPIYHP